MMQGLLERHLVIKGTLFILKKITGLIALISFCVMASAAAEDYTGLKGDFSVFKLGDSPKVIMDKIDYLKKNKITKAEPIIKDNAITIALKADPETVECYLDFVSGKVYMIRACYQTFYNEKKFDQELYRDIQKKQTLLALQFGEPAKIFFYPKFEEIKNNSLKAQKISIIVPIAVWEIQDKKIAVGIYPWTLKANRTAAVFIDEKLAAENNQDLLDRKNIPYSYVLILRDTTYTTEYRVGETSIKYVQNPQVQTKVIDFWLRIDYTQEGRRNAIEQLKLNGVQPEIHQNFKYALYHYQVYQKKYCILSYAYCSYEKQLFSQTYPEPKWVEIALHTTGEAIFKLIRQYAEKKLGK